MPKEIAADRDGDSLVNKAYKAFLFCLLLWLVVWGIAIIVTRDGWAIIAGFFMGLVAAGLCSTIPGVMALVALQNGTRQKRKAILTAVLAMGLSISVVLLYVL